MSPATDVKPTQRSWASPWRWLLVSLAMLLAATLAGGAYAIAGLTKQRSLQAKIESDGRVSIAGSSPHWCARLLPDNWANAWPESRLEVRIDRDAEADSLALLDDLAGVDGLTFFYCELDQRYYQIIARQRNLRAIRFEETPINEETLQQLSCLQRLREITIKGDNFDGVHLPLIAALPALRKLSLRNTRVNALEIEAFVAANPHIDVAWNAALNQRELSLKSQLSARCISTYASWPEEGLQYEPTWSLGLRDGVELTVADLALIKQLGTVRSVDIECNANSDLVESIARIPGIERIELKNSCTLSHLRLLLKSPTLQRLEFDSARLVPEDQPLLKSLQDERVRDRRERFICY